MTDLMNKLIKEYEEKNHKGELMYEEPTLALRWIRRGTEKVLQQCYVQKYVGKSLGDGGYKEVWYDIPFYEGVM
jgi:hypothetical protein